MVLDLLKNNAYVMYVFLVLSALRLTRFTIEDTIFDRFRNFLCYRKKVEGHDIDKEILQYDTTLDVVDKITGKVEQVKTKDYYSKPGKVRIFFRLLLSCNWCAPVWIVSALIPLTIIFPKIFGIINLILGTSYLVSVIYQEVE